MKTYTNEMTGIEWVEIEVAEGQFTAMTKETYEAQQVEHLTEIITPPIKE
jgi:hypothetical protein